MEILVKIDLSDEAKDFLQTLFSGSTPGANAAAAMHVPGSAQTEVAAPAAEKKTRAPRGGAKAATPAADAAVSIPGLDTAAPAPAAALSAIPGMAAPASPGADLIPGMPAMTAGNTQGASVVANDVLSALGLSAQAEEKKPVTLEELHEKLVAVAKMGVSGQSKLAQWFAEIGAKELKAVKPEHYEYLYNKAVEALPA